MQHLEMTRDIAGKFNHSYKKMFELPEAITQEADQIILGQDGRKMSKSYKNIIPLLSTEKVLKKSIAKIVTNSLEPGDPKDFNNCSVFSLYCHFSSDDEQSDLKESYENGISWGDAKNKLFEKVNEHIIPIRESYNSLNSNKDLINELLAEGSAKVRPMAKELLLEVRDSIGISKIS